MIFTQWNFHTCDFTKHFEKIIEIFVSPIFAEAFDIERRLWVCIPFLWSSCSSCSPIATNHFFFIRKSSAEFTFDFWETNFFDEFSSKVDVIEATESKEEEFTWGSNKES